ncbi:16S rRNA (cytosine(1402)-N(4))-methyltransferase RsmH [Rhodovulum sulfidophilum]|uniref:16S rRNA (cytosine(1402)-N(4))-methyltransferase RsmH n=1 Tax=Rhodovulum sulfidophilum TaxID=35806 RepID=UPI0019238BF4|nr:16S rRNA (cytosine(1402)-N(4))-methyltransferase RsmH [Rhodovulum sulfidophilum]MBL3574095.1 16S rRNA (cytosine(1402)-N(4))-methyltransferase RsmH [Rhodovulum sulfidophilum]MCE8432156.1 16S rRNA (cytosine(1402)-N(4))-methyltransferase RsmH [Rhodovulum sulfidophilum]MCF4117503.1 16S rRNA (cytosine(1402)-N(4))-methyltransferase RsmH [Rhodovulum sulfidophilum]
MTAADNSAPADPPHIPVLLRPLLEAVAPVSGLWLDGTFGAGGYSRGLLEAGADRVIGVDRDPSVADLAASWSAGWGDRLQLVEGVFSELDRHAEAPLDGVVLDLGVSSMQLDQAERGFSFAKDGPLDMRMGAEGPSAADLVASASDTALADILFHYGEERASRRIARAIVKARAISPIVTTAQLAEVVARCLPPHRPGQTHPATRSFQAIRIAVNDELGELVRGLEAAERALKPGGKLAVVTFHSLEDRIVKRYLQVRSGQAAGGSRYAPEARPDPARFELVTRRAVAPDPVELEANPRARSAKLRVAIRTGEPAGPVDRARLGLPKIMED